MTAGLLVTSIGAEVAVLQDTLRQACVTHQATVMEP